MPSEHARVCDICGVPTVTPVAANVKASIRHAKCQKEWLRKAWLTASPQGRLVLEDLAKGIQDG
jgi:hypothetical protein